MTHRHGLRCAGLVVLLAVVGFAVVAYAPHPAHAGDAVCPGDCNGDGVVAINELITAVNIALGLAPLSACPAADPDGSGTVTVDDLIKAVNSALEGCPSATPTPVDLLRVTGACRQPGAGPRGLVPCDLGTLIAVWRCNMSATCLAMLEARTRLGDGPVENGGAFDVGVDAAAAARATLLLEAPLPGAKIYRTINIGPAAGRASFARITAGATNSLEAPIGPASEAAVRLLDEYGLQNFAVEGLPAIVEAVEAANVDTDYTGLDAEAAAQKALAVALDNQGVQQAILMYLFTPTPTITPTITSTATATATGPATHTVTASPNATATRTRTASATATRVPTESGSPTATATSSRTPSVTRTATRTVTASSTRTATATRTPTRTASATPTRTNTKTVTPTPSPTKTTTPYLIAQMVTNRGCIETGDNPIFMTGEVATVFFEVDGNTGGMPIDQAHVIITDLKNNIPVGSTEDDVPAFTILSFPSQVIAPTGTETFVLEASAPGTPGDQTQCSFSVVPAVPECTTACDCPTEQRCVEGVCMIAGNALYCCTSMTCPSGENCQFPDGGFNICP